VLCGDIILGEGAFYLLRVMLSRSEMKHVMINIACCVVGNTCMLLWFRAIECYDGN